MLRWINFQFLGIYLEIDKKLQEQLVSQGGLPLQDLEDRFFIPISRMLDSQLHNQLDGGCSVNFN